MMRSRSRSRGRQPPNYRSRSRSPYFNKQNNRFEGNKPFRGNSFFQHGRHNDRRPRENYRQSNFSPRRSPGPYKPRSRSQSPSHFHHQRSHEIRKGPESNDARHTRSPVRYDAMYRRSPTPQRLTTEPIPKDRSIFCGPEGTIIDLNELKKITVDIRRNLPRGAMSGPHGPLRYSFDPSDVILVRRAGEGSRPIFDREELKPRPAEERVIKLAVDLPDNRAEQPLPHPRSHDSYMGMASGGFQQESRSTEGGDGEGDLRFRLMEKKSSEENKERMIADPNFVPQGRYYYEHDNRDKFNNRGRGGFAFRGNPRGNYHSNFQSGNHSAGGFRGNYRGGGGGGGGGGNMRESHRGSYRGKLRSPDWQHDMYDTIPVDDGKPSSTTQI